MATDEYEYDKAYVMRDRSRSTTSNTTSSPLAYDFNKLEELEEDSVASSRSGLPRKTGMGAVMAYERRYRAISASSSVSSHPSVNSKAKKRLVNNYGPHTEVLDIIAPSGKLGLIIDTPNDGPPVIFAIKESSVLGEKVRVDDRLIALDDVDVTSMTAIELSKLISSRNTKPERKLTILRKVKLEP